MIRNLTLYLCCLALAAGLLAALPARSALAATTYYSTGSVAPNTLSHWTTNRDGTGAPPTNFTSGDTFVIQNGHNMTTSGTWSISGAGSKLWIEHGGTLTATSAVTLASATTFQIDAGGTYVHGNATAFGSSIFQGTESFDPSSTVILNNSNTIGPSNVAFGNLIVNFTGDPAGSVNCGGAVTTINGDLSILSTSTREFRLTAGTPFTLNLAGDLIINGGVLNLASGAGAPTINIGGNFNQTGGTFVSSGSVSTVVFTGGGSSVVTFATSGGTFTNTNINWQIASGKTAALNTNLGAGSWVNANRTMTVNGALQINQGAYPGIAGAWAYGPDAALVFNNTSGSYGVGNEAWWPSGSGRPTHVTVQGSGGITMNTARTVAGIFQTAATVTNAHQLTLDGAAQLNAGGYFASSPVYGPASTLVYNTGSSYNTTNEWTSGDTVGSGVPKHVTIQNNTAVVLPNGAASRTVSGDLIIASGSLTLGDNVGDDLAVGGDWVNDGAFHANSRLVSFAGSAAQTIGGSAETAFAYLAIANPAGVSLNRAASVANQLALASGRLSLGNYDLTLGSDATVSGTPDSTRMVVTDLDGAQNGRLCKQGVTASGFTYPIGDARAAAEYTPVTFTPTDPSGLTVCFRVVDDKNPNLPPQVTTDYLTRYWVGEKTAGSFANTTSASFTFIDDSSDVVGDIAGMTPKKWNGAYPWEEDASALTGTPFTYTGLEELSQFTAFRSGVLAVTLAAFSAEQQGDAVLVTWETASEIDNRGFNLYRGVSPDGWERCLNEYLIPSQGQGSPSGFEYSWQDEADLAAGTTYHYWLEDVDVHGATTLHGPVSVDYSGPTALRLDSVSASPATQTAGKGSPAWAWVMAAACAALVLTRLRPND